MAVASEDARFCLSEVRLGLIPAVISPYVIGAIGARAARRYFLTAEPFDAADALRLGLVHEVVPAAELEATGARLSGALLANGPRAVAAAKRLVADVAGARPGDELVEETARRIADIRATDEAREGMAAFLEKRPPLWSGS
jgi:methylglutaconyl-CoA hydratase